MSIFGEPLPHEDDTATSLIRRTGYPPEGTYDQMPQTYLCPCCSEFSQDHDHDRVSRAAKDQKEAERRRLLQLDVFDERAKPLPSEDTRRKLYRRINEEEPQVAQQEDRLPPPPSLEDLRNAARQNQGPPSKLIVTVHHGKNLRADPRDRMSVVVRCGSFEGQTAQVPRGKEVLTTWDELFEFPYPNPQERLEVLVLSDAIPVSEDHVLGGIIVPAKPLHDRQRGDRESLPVVPEEQMHDSFDNIAEGPNGAVVVSWYVSQEGEGAEDGLEENKNLENPLGCTFVVHRMFQYTDNGSKPYPGGMLCVLRDTDDNCSESVVYSPGSMREPALSPYYAKEGYHYLPENPSQIMQLNTEKKLGHILVCVPKQDDAPGEEEDEELLVVGAVPLDFERLHHKGRAVLLIESKSKDDALWGEITIEWLNRPISDDDEVKPLALEVQKESLFLTVVRGLNLADRNGNPVEEAHVSVATGDMEGTTLSAPNVKEGENAYVIHWNQEVRFIDVAPDAKEIEVYAFEKDRPVCTGRCELNDDDEGVVVVTMHDLYKADTYRGEIVISYKRLHVPVVTPPPSRAVADPLAHDEVDEEQDEEQVEEQEELVQHHVYNNGAAEEEIVSIRDEEEDHHDERALPQQSSASESAPDVMEESGADDGMYPTEEDDGRAVEPLAKSESSAASEPEEEQPEEDEEAADEEDDVSSHHDEDDGMYPTEDQDGHVVRSLDELEDSGYDDFLEEDEESNHGDYSGMYAPKQKVQAPPKESSESKRLAQGGLYPIRDPSMTKRRQEPEMYPTEKPHKRAVEPPVEEEPVAAPHSEEEYEDEAEESNRDSMSDMYPTEDPVDHRTPQEEPEMYPTEDPVDHRTPQEEPEMYPTEDNYARDIEPPAMSEEKEEEMEEPFEEEEDYESKHDDHGDMYPTEDPVDHHTRDEMYPTEEHEVQDGAPRDAELYPTERDPTIKDDISSEGARDSHVSPAPREAVGTAPNAGERRYSRGKINWAQPQASPYKQPFFPAGSTVAPIHIPYEKSVLSKANKDSINELEVRRSRVVEESVRRGLTPRRMSQSGPTPRGPNSRGYTPRGYTPRGASGSLSDNA